MQAFQATGDSETGRRLFALYRDPLWRFLRRLCSSDADADDLSQRAWMRLIEVAEKNSYRPHANATFKTYLFTIARNLVIDDGRLLSARSVHVDVSSVAGSLQAGGLAPDVEADAAKANIEIARALAELPYEQREVLAMWAEGFGFDEIADIVDAPRNTVIGRKRYGLEKLRAALSEDVAEGVKNG
ncbi:MAG: sigma-70 family RNA polymerase sigma factor [Gammaproteobacteria bacterium]|nr:sigma-70 family RNA polymerase sigma factor [Gammaproteobacteria bacterium]